MFAAADKILRVLTILVIGAPAISMAAGICFRSAPNAQVRGIKGDSTITVLWSDNGDTMDGIRVVGQGKIAGADMNCNEASPVVCGLGKDGGSLRLVFDQDRVKIVSSGLQVKFDEARRPRLSVRRAKLSTVQELYPISADDCRLAFPNTSKIVIFPDQEPSEPPAAPGVPATR